MPDKLMQLLRYILGEGSRLVEDDTRTRFAKKVFSSVDADHFKGEYFLDMENYCIIQKCDGKPYTLEYAFLDYLAVLPRCRSNLIFDWAGVIMGDKPVTRNALAESVARYNSHQSVSMLFVMLAVVVGGTMVLLRSVLPVNDAISAAAIVAFSTIAGVSTTIQALKRGTFRIAIFALTIYGLITIHGFAEIYRSAGAVGDRYPKDYYECLYFSVVTCTTLGYGDFQPPSACRGVAAFEALLGYVFMAIIAAVVIKSIDHTVDRERRDSKHTRESLADMRAKTAVEQLANGSRAELWTLVPKYESRVKSFGYTSPEDAEKLKSVASETDVAQQKSCLHCQHFRSEKSLGMPLHLGKCENFSPWRVRADACCRLWQSVDESADLE
jgi:hypothetical protein